MGCSTGYAALIRNMQQHTSCVVLVAMIVVCNLTSGGLCTHTQQEIYVPSYVYPCSNTAGCAWDVFKANATLVIINPNSGPGTTANPDYVTLVNTVKTGNSKVKIVVGYVSTSYGSRASSLVLADIDNYYSWYNVDGIFLAQGSTSCNSTILALYKSYDARVKANAGLGYTVLDWGVYGSQCYLNNTHIDNYVTFTDIFTKYTSVGAPPAWVNSYDSSRFWNILHTAPDDAASVTAAVATAKSRNVGQVYITNDVEPNPYDTAPSSTVWTAQVSTAQSYTLVPDPAPNPVPNPAPNPVPNPVPDASPSSNRRMVGIIAGVCAGVGAALLLAGFSITKYRWRSSYTKKGKFNLVDQNLVPRMFEFKELSKATRNFSRSEFLGSGGYGAVYRGTLPSGALVAVKRMRHESKHVEEGFQAEAASLSQIRHRNLVQLRGWCHEEDELLLVYDYMCNGSLYDWLFQFSKQKGKESLNLNSAEALPLTLRRAILSGVAAALSYLHEECKQCVLHRDIKSSNVLLDDGLNASLGDFGLARLIDHQKIEKTTMMAGTLGYMAPEMPHTGKATKESDVFSFGVLMLEVMCGARPLDMRAIEQGDGVLVDRAWRAHEAGDILQMADPKLGTFPPSNADSGSFQLQESPRIFDDLDPSEIAAPEAAMEDKKMVANLLHLGLLCCNPNPEDRPSMRLVSQLLQASENMQMSLPPLPRCKPQASYFRPGFSQFNIGYSSSSLRSVLSIEGAGKGSLQSTPPSSGV